MRIGSYTGQLLRINLKTKSIRKEKLDRKILKQYLGSKGLSAYILFNELEPGIDPLSPKNKLAFMTGPLTGTNAPAPNRFSVSAKSPLTNAWCDSHCGGSWGPELKFAGYDGIIVEDQSPTPVYISIADDKVQILDANFIWGSDTFSTERLLKDKHGHMRMPRVASIGPAGERKSLLACVISEVRAAGRGGMGAVMGSKNLKAIVVAGTKYGPEDLVHNRAAFRKHLRDCSSLISKHKTVGPAVGGTMCLYGTAKLVNEINGAGGWPTRNFQTGVFEHASEIAGQAYARTLWIPNDAPGSRPCYHCPILCAHAAIVREGKHRGLFDEGPEYETIWSLGAQCGVSGREAIAKADYLCDYYGIDTISAGNTIGFLMECYEKGFLTKEDTDGTDLRFGNADAMVAAIEAAGAGIGKLGDLVGNGVKKAAQIIGHESERFAIHSKGLEVPAYSPRAAQGMGLNYAIGDRGGCHLQAWTAGDEMVDKAIDATATEGKAKLVKRLTEETNVAWDSTGVCRFVGNALSPENMYELVNAATGLGYKNLDEFLIIGERINNLTRAFNVREGFSKKDDTHAYRILHEPLPEGPCKGQVLKLEPMLVEYYEVCGWDADGKPKKEKLQELGLDFATKQLQL